MNAAGEKFLESETRIFVELYGNTSARFLQPYSYGFWKQTKDILPIRHKRANEFIDTGHVSKYSDNFFSAYREMLADSQTDEFEFKLEGTLEVAAEVERIKRVSKYLAVRNVSSCSLTCCHHISLMLLLT